MKEMRKQNFSQMQDFLINTQTPHTIKICNNSTSIKVHKKTYFFSENEKIDPSYLTFIKEVKSEVCDNSERLNIPTKKPQYFGFNGISKKRIIRNAVEIDINGAYWQTARKLGLITETTYQKGMEVPKQIRLMAFGSAATLKDVYVFDGEQYTDSYNEFNQWGRNAFFYVSNEVTELIKSILEKVPGIFSLYWVDAVFIHSLYQSYVCEALENAGYDYKIKQVPFISIQPGDDCKPDRVRMIYQKSETFPRFEKKTFSKHKKNNNKNRKKIIKSPLFAVQ